MTHAGHDPIADHATCQECNAALRRAFNALADLPLGPRAADVLVDRLRREALGLEVVR